MDVLFVADPPALFDPSADSTHVMVTEALRRGLRPFGTTLLELGLNGADAEAVVAPFVLDQGHVAHPAEVARERRPLSSFGVVLMRKDPPVDETYVTATWILDRAGTLVVNAPSGLRELNEKLSIARFAELSPRTWVERDAKRIEEIIDEAGGRAIIKPVYGYGGKEILLARADDPNLSTLIEMATADGTRWTVAQEYLPAAAEGDKRILMIDGEPAGAVLRVPAKGQLRNNFHAGGRPALSALDDNDRAICSAVGPVLRELGQVFVGIDVIGGKLTEINVTSPTGMQEVNRLEDLSGDDTMQDKLWDCLQQKVAAP
ncbi:MAG: glutathione synthase [Myxococcota bacterium]